MPDNQDTIIIHNNLDELNRVRESVKTFAGEYFDPLDLNRVILAVDEALANIMEHAYGDDSNASIELDMYRDGDLIRFTLRDRGPRFDPTGLPRPDLNEVGHNERDGGLGVFLFTTLMQAEYNRLPEGVNELILSKKISKH